MRQAREQAKAETPDATHVLETSISYLLRAGVVTSLGFIVAGMAVTLLRHPDYLFSEDALVRVTAPGNRPHSIRDIWEGLQATRGQAFVMVGLLWMMLVPFVRVGLSFFAFRQQKDTAFSVVTGTVLALLMISVVVGTAAHP